MEVDIEEEDGEEDGEEEEAKIDAQWGRNAGKRALTPDEAFGIWINEEPQGGNWRKRRGKPGLWRMK